MTSSVSLQHVSGVGDRHRTSYRLDFQPARLRVNARTAATVIGVDGEINVSNAAAIAGAIYRFSRLNAPLVLDCSRTAHLSVSGLTALRAVHRGFCDGGQLHRIVTGEALRRVVSITGDHYLPTVASVAEAVEIIAAIVAARRRLPLGLARQHEPQTLNTTTADATYDLSAAPRTTASPIGS